MDFVHPVEAVIPGTQGRVLAVLAETTAELNLRTVARLASVSPAQASRVLPGLVELGLVERREVPPSSLFRLSRQNVAARVVIELARSRDIALERMGAAARELALQPVSVIVFGSFARHQADRHSDIDAVIVRPDGVDDDDDTWTAGVEQWRENVRAITGNPVEVIETDRAEASEKLSSKRTLWRDIARDGVVVHGATLDNSGARSVPKPMRTRPVSAAQVRAYANKAQEYGEAAASELESERYIAATSLAIHAAINAADAVCGARLGHRAADEDHDQVLTLLKQAGRDGANVEKDLRRLLPLKTKAEYEPYDVAPGVAKKAVERAHRCVAIAQAMAASSR